MRGSSPAMGSGRSRYRCSGTCAAWLQCLGMSDRMRITYIGPPPFVGELARRLEENGASVNYSPPIETKDMATAMEAVSVVLEVVRDVGVGLTVDMIVRNFEEDFRGTRVEGVPVADATIEDRLARLDDMLAKGLVSAEEHAEHRARILREL